MSKPLPAQAHAVSRGLLCTLCGLAIVGAFGVGNRGPLFESRSERTSRLYIESEELQRGGDFSRAAEKLEEALRISPSSYGIRESLANLYDTLGRRPDAEALFLEGMARYPGDPRLPYGLVVNFYLPERRYADSLPLLERAIAYEPLEPMYWRLKGLCLERLGDWTEAEEHWQKALSFFGNDGPGRSFELGLNRVRKFRRDGS